MTADARRSPLTGFAGLTLPTLTIAESPFIAQHNARAFAGGSAFGIALPQSPNTVARTGEVAALWLGPDEWLLIGAEPPADARGIVDVSAQRTTIVVSGQSTIELLAFGCPLDLAAATGEWCAQTTVGRANVIMWGIGPDEVRLLVRASFARYLADWLLDAATELRHAERELSDA